MPQSENDISKKYNELMSMLLMMGEGGVCACGIDGVDDDGDGVARFK